jgi:hypothetical protein
VLSPLGPAPTAQRGVAVGPRIRRDEPYHLGHDRWRNLDERLELRGHAHDPRFRPEQRAGRNACVDHWGRVHIHVDGAIRRVAATALSRILPNKLVAVVPTTATTGKITVKNTTAPVATVASAGSYTVARRE